MNVLKLQTRHLDVLSDLALELSELHQNEVDQKENFFNHRD